MKYHKSISTVSVFTFYSIIETRDFRLLIKNHKKKDNKHVTPDLLILLEESFNKISLEFSAKTVTSQSIKQSKAKIEIDYLEAKYKTTVAVVDLYLKFEKIEVLFALNDLGWSFKSEKEVDQQLSKLLKNIKGLKNKVKIKKLKYHAEFIKNLKEKVDGSYIDSMDKKALYIESVLEKKYPINTKKTTLLRWCNLLEMCANKSKING